MCNSFYCAFYTEELELLYSNLSNISLILLTSLHIPHTLKNKMIGSNQIPITIIRKIK